MTDLLRTERLNGNPRPWLWLGVAGVVVAGVGLLQDAQSVFGPCSLPVSLITLPAAALLVAAGAVVAAVGRARRRR